MEFLIAVLVVGVVLAFIIIGHLQIQARRKTLALFAEQNGLTFTPGPMDEDELRDMGYELLQRGHNRRASEAISGSHAGHEVILFDYEYKTGSGKNETMHRYICCAWRLPVPLTRIAIRPEGIFDRVAEWFGGNDIDFESEEFSRRYHVVGDDRREVYAVIDARMMAFLLDSDLQCLEIIGDLALAYRDDNALTPPLCEWFLALADGFCRNLPEHLLREKRGSRPATGTF